MNFKLSATLLLALTVTVSCFSQTKKDSNTNNLPLYKNPKAPVAARVDDLLKRMTLDEKIGEMTQLCLSSITLDGTKSLDLNIDKVRDYIRKDHVGSFLSGTGKAEKWVKFIDQMQHVAMTETRLGIPVIFGMDHVHGADYVDEGTILPHNLNLSCSFNATLAESAARITAIESADLGHTWNFAPVLDVGKNPYWPRFYETFGEDPYLCSVMGSAFIKAFQNCPDIAPYRLAATAKHFIGYSDPRSGWDRAPSEIPDQILHEIFVPSFKAAFAAGVKTLMVNSGELNGEPVHGSKRILTDLLRQKLGFEGVVVTDIKDILKIQELHGAAHDEREATKMAVDAGIDMYMACSTVDFQRHVKDYIEKGELTEARLDESVRRILKLKFELGLFENPYPRADRLNKIGSKTHYQQAIEAARESVVLLKNDNNTLPLPKTTKNIVVAGFAANSKKLLNGAWTFEWMGAEEARQPKNMETIYTALQKEFTGANVTWVDSAERPNSNGFKTFQEKAKQADVIVITAGEQPYSEFKGNATDLILNPDHINLVKAAQATGKPVVLILIEGRPRIITEIKDKTQAILFAGHPGVGGAVAVAEILSGKTNPSGKLSFTYPAQSGHHVPYYNKKSDFGHTKPINYVAPYPFGHGLSYTTYIYSNLTLSHETISTPTQQITASVTITNTGKREGKEALLWFVQDEVGRITRPAKMLKHVEKKTLKPGESQVLSFTIDPQTHFTYPDHTGNSVLEDGYFKIMVGNQEKRVLLKR